MKHFSSLLLLAAFLLAQMTRGLFGQSEPAAVFVIEVVNNTAGGATVAGDAVTLQLHRHQQPLEALRATVGEDGKATFERVPTGPHMLAMAHVEHQNMAFRSPPVSLDPKSERLSTTVQVYDVSTDTSKLSVGMHHIMLAVHDTGLQVTEYLQLRNSSDRAVTGAERDAQNRPVVMRFLLPERFTDLAPSSYLERSSLIVTPEGFYDTLATPPGEHRVVFSYRLPIKHRTLDIARRLSLATSEVAVFWEQGQGCLEGLGEPESRLVNAEGVPIEHYRRMDLKPGAEIAFRVSGLNAAASDRYTWVVLVVVFAVVVVVALVRLRAKPSQR